MTRDKLAAVSSGAGASGGWATTEKVPSLPNTSATNGSAAEGSATGTTGITAAAASAGAAVARSTWGGTACATEASAGVAISNPAVNGSAPTPVSPAEELSSTDDAVTVGGVDPSSVEVPTES